MAYEIVETADTLAIHGNCFIDELITGKTIVVDGDLVADRVAARAVSVVRGSLLCPKVSVMASGSADAEILGVYALDRAFVAPKNWSYRWLRPVFGRPDERKWSSEHSIRGVAATLEHPAIVAKHVGSVTAALEKALARPTCGRARVLFHFALEELRDHDALTPLGAQVVACMLREDDLPKNWRW